MPEHVWVDANGTVDVQGRAGEQVPVGWRGANPQQLACTDIGLEAQKLAGDGPRRIDGYIRQFDLHASPGGEIVMRDMSASRPMLVTDAVRVIERNGSWVHVRDALSIAHHFDGWVRSDVFVTEPFDGMWADYHVFVHPTHRTTEVTELYEPKCRAPLGIEVASGVPITLTGPVDGDFVAVALPGIIAQDPPQFFIPSSAIVENQ